MASVKIFFLVAIFYVNAIIKAQSQNITDNSDGTENGVTLNLQGTDSDNPIKIDLVEEYRRVCNRSEIEKGKFSCAKTGNSSNITVHTVLEQNKVIMESLIQSFIRPQPIPEFEPITGFKLLEKTFSIYRKFCPAVAPSFLGRVENLFKTLNYRFATMRTEFFADSEEHVTWINLVLDRCLNNSESLDFMMSSCKEMILGRKGEDISFICTTIEEETNYKLYDPILDSIWSVMNAVRSGCFKYFHGAYQMWHHYFLALMDTFATSIQLRWNNQIEEEKYWKQILGSNFQIHLGNMVKCTKVIAEDSELGPYKISIARGQFVPYVRLIGSE